MEIWADIPGFNNLYQASNLGRIKVKSRKVEKFCGLIGRKVTQQYAERLLNPSKSSALGHCNVHISVNNVKYNLAVHRAVLMAFVGMPPDGTECCHNNGIADDNRLENLRWDTHFNNNQDRKRHGTYPSGVNHPMYGRKMPIELKKRLLDFHTGRKASDETKAKMSEAHKLRWETRRVSKQKIA
jgi:hypothetical protein